MAEALARSGIDGLIIVPISSSVKVTNVKTKDEISHKFCRFSQRDFARFPVYPLAEVLLDTAWKV